MQTSTAFLAGAGTIVAALAIGLGGGFLAANVMNPKTPKQGAEASRLERRISPEAAAAGAQQPAASHAEAWNPIPQTEASKPPRPANQLANVPLGAATAPAQADPAVAPPAAPAQSAKDASGKPAQPSSDQPREATSQTAKSAPNPGPDDAHAKADDEDVTRAAEADARKGLAERRRAERHQRWLKRHRYQARREQERREALNGRDDGGDRDDGSRPHVRGFGFGTAPDADPGSNSRGDNSRGNVAQPRFEFPQVRLFESDSDD